VLITKRFKKCISIFLAITIFASYNIGQPSVLLANEQNLSNIAKEDLEHTLDSEFWNEQQNATKPIVTKNKITFPKQFMPSMLKNGLMDDSGLYIWEERYLPRPKKVKTEIFKQDNNNVAEESAMSADFPLEISGQIDTNTIESEQNTDLQLVTNETNQNNLSQAEIDEIINEHMLSVEDKVYPQDEIANQTMNRFIIKYKDKNIKNNKALKADGSFKQAMHSNNKHFDVFITNNKMTLGDLKKLVDQEGANPNIEYIQPDYQMTVASEDTP